MKYLFSGIACILMMQIVVAQNKKSLTPDMLWKIGRVSARGITKDKKYVIYTVSNPQVSENKFQKTTYKVD
ncbi:MAG: hypothetical protein WCP65_07480, partial [Bacteroidota bacterium]